MAKRTETIRHASLPIHARITLDAWGEHRVELYIDGDHRGRADAFEETRADARGTARAVIEHAAATYPHTPARAPRGCIPVGFAAECTMVEWFAAGGAL